MGTLYDAKLRIDKVIADRKLDPAAVRGKLGMEAGFLISMLGPSTADDPAKLDKLKKAARSVLQVEI